MQNGKDRIMKNEGQIDVIKLIKPFEIELTNKQVNILLALSDNEGYAEYQLVEKIGSNKTYVNDLLQELSSYKFGGLWESYSIEYWHFKDPLALFHKLQDQRDPVSKYLFSNMHIKFKESLTSSDLKMVMVGLSYGLSSFLSDAHLYSQKRFADVKLSEDAKKWLILKEKLDGRNIRVLNRILIADAYPNEICKAKISLIHKESRLESNKSRHPYFINLDLRTFYFIESYLEYEMLLDRSRLAVMEMRLGRINAGYDKPEDPFDINPKLRLF